MVTIGTATNRPIAFSLTVGVLGGSALISTVSMTTRGTVIYLPYAAIVLATAVFLRYERVRPFARRFSLALGSFMCATLLLYLFIGLVAARTLFMISMVGHAWRLGLMLGIGALLSAGVAHITSTDQSDLSNSGSAV